MENHNPMESVREDDPTQPSPSNDTQPDTPAAAASDQVAALKSDLAAASAKAAEYLDGWQRARAEFANYKRRIEREQVDLTQNISANVLARILPVLDDFDLAMKNAPADDESAKWTQGILLVHRKLNDLLAKEGISRIEAEGLPFDPNVHEAVMHVEVDGQPSGQVIEVLRQGYKLGDRVLRPALVKVAK
jgi:molecular chaperone GrpE